MFLFQEESNYDFLSCFKRSVAKEIGCKLPWDVWNQKSIPVCDTFDQINNHLLWDRFGFHFEQKTLIERTGCLVPCKYREYNIVTDPQRGSSLDFWLPEG